MKKSEIMKEARKYLSMDGTQDFGSNPKYAYICICVTHITGPMDAFSLEREIVDEVLRRINNHFVFDNYMREKLGVPEYKDIYEVISREEMQEQRLALMNEMIAYYEETGE